MISSLRAARAPLFALGALSALLAGCGGGGTNLPTPGSGNGTLGDRNGNAGTGAGTGTGTGTTGPILRASSIVFVSTRDGNPEIYSMNVDGTGATRLTNDAAVDEQPARSADGNSIVFSSQRDGNAEIYKMNADGSGLQRLTTDTGPVNESPVDQRPVFSPDSQSIVWQSTRGGVTRLWTMDASGANQGPLIFSDTLPTSFDGSWNPDSARVLGFTTSTSNPNLNDLILITRSAPAGSLNAYQTLSSALNGTHPRYAPGGTRIVYSNASTAGAATLQFLDANGAPIAGAPTGGTNQLGPSFSPDGARLVWDANASINASSPQRQLYIATLGTGTATGTPLTTGTQGENYDASWTQ